MAFKTVLATAMATIAVSSLSSAASAQSSGIVIMRKVIDPRVDNALLPPSIATPTPTPTSTPTSVPAGYYSWVVTDWVQSGTCGSQGAETRSVSCKRTDGVAVDDTLCSGNGSGPKPISSEPTTITATCSFSWRPGDWGAPSSTCGNAVETRDVTCTRSDGSTADASKCSVGSKPADYQVVPVVSGCTFRWSPGAWGEPSTQCGDATQTRTVSCLRSDDTTADDASCGSAGVKPDATQSVHETVGCSNVWVPSAWGTPQAGCGNVVATRTVACQRSDGVTVADDQCTDAKPALTEPAVSYATCTDGRSAAHPYGWSIGDYGPLSTTCGDATRTRVVTCTDNDGKAVDDSQCVTTKPSATVSSHEIGGCGFSWHTGDFGAAQPACGATVQNRDVSCLRADGTTVADSSCSAQPKPSATQPASDYSSCSFGWAPGAWSDVSTTCGDATQTRTVVCQRSDGTAAADAASCTGTKPETTQSSHQVSGCGFAWSQGATTVTPACGATTSTQMVTCQRSDGQTVDDAQCAQIGAKPATSQAATDYSICTFTWAVGAYSASTTTCGAATQTRTVTCSRSDGTTASDASCSGAGAKPDATQTTQQTSGCTYSWLPAAYGAATPACGASTHSRTVSCSRSDGTTADASLCAGPMPATSEATTDYSTCGYTWNVSAWNGSATCGSSATQTRTVGCLRGDGSSVSDATCLANGSGPKPAASQTVTDYSGCSYAWTTVNGAWSSTCSSAATRTNTVTCVRSDKVAVDDSFCTATKPATTDTQAVVSSCTYVGTYGSPTVCTSSTPGSTAGTQTVTLASCQRSDGTTVANTFCTPATKSQACVPDNTSDQYARLPAVLEDPYQASSQSQAYRYNSNPTTGSVYNFTVASTLCWDSVNAKAASATFCSALAYGPNVYDLLGVPAVYVADLHEVYVSQADLTAANVHSGSYFNYSNTNVSVSTICAGSTFNVLNNGARDSWTMRCGTPDSAGHYARQPSALEDPSRLSGVPTASKSVNIVGGSAFSFAVRGTLCWDTTANASALSSKCAYLPTGSNVYDLLALPATYVTDLREVYVGQSDLQAALQNGSAIYNSTEIGSSISTICTSGLNVNAYVGGVLQGWTMRCGTPDTSSHYARQPLSLEDPYKLSGVPSASRAVNVNTASTFSLAVRATQCWDTTTGATAASGKCTYLPTGTNVYDLLPLPATYVTDLREVYINQTDLQAALQHGTTIYNYVESSLSVASVCSGTSMDVIVAGAVQTWTLRCGTPDTASHYVRYAKVVGDPYNYFSTAANKFSNNSTYTVLISNVGSIGCMDTTTNTEAASGKCTYLPTGANQYDQISVPAVYVTAGMTVTVKLADLKAAMPYAPAVEFTSSSYICGAYYNVSAPTVTHYTVVCK